jgi:2-pyrone-4,6-dicarboxylate lactonase
MKSIPPPRTEISAPTFRLPDLACDAHCHVFGPGEKFPYADNRRYTPPDAPAEKLFALHTKLGVQRTVLVQASVHGSDNAAMLDAIAKRPNSMRGVAMVSPTVSESELRALHAGGVRAVRYNFVAHLGGAPDLDEIRTMAARIKPLGWHLVFHLDAVDLSQYSDFVKSMPVVCVIDHMGRAMVEHGINQSAFDAMVSLLKTPHVWVKVSGAERISAALSNVDPPYVDAAPFARKLIDAAPDRVLWGTDWPHPNVREMPDDGKLVDLLPHFHEDEEIIQRVLVKNPAKLYWYE